jgi:hypothetical protein
MRGKEKAAEKGHLIDLSYFFRQDLPRWNKTTEIPQGKQDNKDLFRPFLHCPPQAWIKGGKLHPAFGGW